MHCGNLHTDYLILLVLSVCGKISLSKRMTFQVNFFFNSIQLELIVTEICSNCFELKFINIAFVKLYSMVIRNKKKHHSLYKFLVSGTVGLISVIIDLTAFFRQLRKILSLNLRWLFTFTAFINR